MVVTAARNRVLTIAELHDQLFHSGELREVEIGGYLQAMLASIVATVSQGADFSKRKSKSVSPFRCRPTAQYQWR